MARGRFVTYSISDKALEVLRLRRAESSAFVQEVIDNLFAAEYARLFGEPGNDISRNEGNEGGAD